MYASSSFLITLLAEHAVCVHSEYSATVEQMDWAAFRQAVGALEDAARTRASDPARLARALEEHATSELSGAEVIKWVADTATAPAVRCALRKHAADEKRHSRIFHALSRLAAPIATRKGLYPVEKPDPFLDQYDGDLNSFLCDTHFAELRNIFYLHAFKSSVSHPEERVRRKIQSGLSRVLADEERHVASTGRFINEFLPSDAHMPVRLHHAFTDYVSFIREEASNLASEDFDPTPRRITSSISA